MGVLREVAAKMHYLLRETIYVIRAHKFYFLAPILLMLVLLACVAYYVGPSIVVSFIYAGV